MTNITWQDGGPVFKQPAAFSAYSLVAVDGECCCAPPCICPDFCIYKIEVVSPTSLASQSEVPVECSVPTDIRRNEDTITPIPSNLCDVAECQPWIIPGPGNLTHSYVQLSASARGWNGLYANVGESFFVTGFPEWSGNTCYITFGISVEIGCIDYAGPVPSFYVTIRAGFFLHLNNLWTDGSSDTYGAYRVATFALTPSECETVGASRAVCPNMPGRLARYITTPLTIDASWATTSLGDYESYDDPSAPPYIDPRYQALLDAILGSFSATFRITSRENCSAAVYCDCDAITEGLKIILSPIGFDDDVTFIWNDEEQVQANMGMDYFYSITYSPIGGGNEAQIVYEVWDFFITELQFRHTVKIFCEAIPGGIPSPYRWYYQEEGECFLYDGGTVTHTTKQTYIGQFNCAADPCGTNGRGAGDLYPAGDPEDLELISTVTPPGYSPCSLSLYYWMFERNIQIINDAECPE